MTEIQDTPEASFPLRAASLGETVVIVSLQGGKSFHDRLLAMGLKPGARLEVIQNRGGGRVLVDHRGSRFFLGGGMAHKVQVTLVQGEESQ